MAPVYLPIPIDLLPLAAVIGTGSVLAVRAGVSAIRRDRARARHGRPDGAWNAVPGQNGSGPPREPFTASFGSSLLDVEFEAREALRQVDGLAAGNRVRLQIAIQPDLAVRADPHGFRRALIEMLENAIGHSPCGKVLVGGTVHGGRVQIAVLDDGQGPDRLAQEAVLRPAERIVALHGGTLHVETRPGQGTLVVMRLPAPAVASVGQAGTPPGSAQAAPAAMASRSESEAVPGG